MLSVSKRPRWRSIAIGWPERQTERPSSLRQTQESEGREETRTAGVRLGIVGGRLQGTEAAYLAGAAGYQTVLVDREPRTPASGLAGEVHVFDLLKDEARSRTLLMSCDAVLPACENDDTLDWLALRLSEWGVPLLFDRRAYSVTRSKLASDLLFARLDVPRPLPWPCSYPVIVKPSGASGSEGVRLATDEMALSRARAALEAAGHEVVVQEYVDGPSLSVEVVAWRGRPVVLPPTALEFDAAYDCKRVTAPVQGSAALLDALDQAAVDIAGALALRGVMDVEVMVRGDEPKVIEVDARLPSQTPTVVLHASGLNIVQLLVESALSEGVPERSSASPALSHMTSPLWVDGHGPGVVLEHVGAKEGRLEVLGEHVVAKAGPLHRRPGLFGAYDLLTDYETAQEEWAATIITREADLLRARRAAAQVVDRMASQLDLELVPESEPPPWEPAPLEPRK